MHFARRSALTIGLMALPGCNTASLQDVAPTAAVVLPEAAAPTPSPNPAAPASIEESAAAGPTDTGTFPNLNVRPEAATAQLSDAEKATQIARINAARAGQGNPAGASAAELARLKKLAKTHGAAVIDEIEK